MKPKICIIVISFIVSWYLDVSVAQEIAVIGYNVESGGADPNEVAKRIAKVDGCDIWRFCEVSNQNWADIFETAAEDGENADFKQIFGSTGGADKLLIIYDGTGLNKWSLRNLIKSMLVVMLELPLLQN